MSLLNIEEAEPLAYPASPADLSPAAAALAPALVWSRIESFIRYRWGERQVMWIVEGGACSWTPSLAPATDMTLDYWSLEAEDWKPVDKPKKTPLGGFLLARNETSRIMATVGSNETPPARVLEAYRRLAEYMAAEQTAPAGAKSYSIDVGQISESIRIDPNFAARSIFNSGAGDLLRPYRRLGVNDANS